MKRKRYKQYPPKGFSSVAVGVLFLVIVAILFGNAISWADAPIPKRNFRWSVDGTTGDTLLLVSHDNNDTLAKVIHVDTVLYITSTPNVMRFEAGKVIELADSVKASIILINGFALPEADGTVDQVLTTDGSGTWYWKNAPGAAGGDDIYAADIHADSSEYDIVDPTIMKDSVVGDTIWPYTAQKLSLSGGTMTGNLTMSDGVTGRVDAPYVSMDTLYLSPYQWFGFTDWGLKYNATNKFLICDTAELDNGMATDAELANYQPLDATLTDLAADAELDDEQLGLLLGLYVKNGASPGFIDFYEASGGGTEYIKIIAPAIGTGDGYSITLPQKNTNNGYVWTNDGNGVGSWTAKTSVAGYMEDEDINTFTELQSWVSDETILKSGYAATTLTGTTSSILWINAFTTDVKELDFGSESGTYLKASGGVLSWDTPAGGSSLWDSVQNGADSSVYKIFENTLADSAMFVLTPDSTILESNNLIHIKGGGTGVLINDDLTITTAKTVTLGSTQWNNSDNIEGEVIADNTIDEDAIDWGTGTDQVDILDIGAANTSIWYSTTTGFPLGLDYSGQGGKYLRANSGGTAMEFATVSGTGLFDSTQNGDSSLYWVVDEEGVDSFYILLTDAVTKIFSHASNTLQIGDSGETHITDLKLGIYDGADKSYAFPNVKTTDNGYIWKFNTATSEMEWAADATGGTPTYNSIGDPDGDGSIGFGAWVGTYTSATDGWGGLTISNTVADMTSADYLLTLSYTDDGDVDADFFRCMDAVSAVKFSIQEDGDVQTTGNIDLTAGNITLAASATVDGIDVSAIAFDNMPTAPTGAVSFNSQNITTVGTVDGVDVGALNTAIANDSAGYYNTLEELVPIYDPIYFDTTAATPVDMTIKVATTITDDQDSVPSEDAVYEFCETTQDYLKTGDLSTSETDPVYIDDPAFGITAQNITDWGTAATDLTDWFGSSQTTTAGYVPIGNAGNTQYVGVEITGDVTVTSTGVTAIGTGKVTSDDILNSEIVNDDINGSAAIAWSKISAAVVTGDITDGTILAADLDFTVAPGAGNDNYAVTYDDGGKGFTLVEMTGGGLTHFTDSDSDDSSVLAPVTNTWVKITGNLVAGDSGVTHVTDLKIGRNDSTVMFMPEVDSTNYDGLALIYYMETGAVPDSIAPGQISLTAAVTGTLPVDNGGTERATLTDGAVLVGDGTSPVEMLTLTNGQLLIGSTGASPSTAILTDGTAITITEGAGTITIGVTDGSIGPTQVAGLTSDDFTTNLRDTITVGQYAYDSVLVWGTRGYPQATDALLGIASFDASDFDVAAGVVTIDNVNFDLADIPGGTAPAQTFDFSAATVNLADFGTMTKTGGYVLVADGADFESVEMTGDVTIASGGATTIGHDVLDDQYYDSESDLTTLLDDNYGTIGGETWTGVHNFGGATSVEIPAINDPGTTIEGHIAWDANDDAIEVYMGDETESALIPAYQRLDALIYAPGDVNDEVCIFHVDALVYPFGIEIDKVSIQLDDDLAYSMVIEEWSGADPPVYQSVIETVTTGVSDTYAEDTSPADGAIDADDKIYLDIPVTAPAWVHVQIIFHVNDGS